MTTYSQLTDVERRKVLDLAHTVIEDANAGRYDASQLEALAARTRAATPSQGSEQALQIADAIDTLAAQMRAGRLPGRFHDPETLKKPIYTPVAELDDKQRRLVEQTALEEIAFFGAAGDRAARSPGTSPGLVARHGGPLRPDLHRPRLAGFGRHGRHRRQNARRAGGYRRFRGPRAGRPLDGQELKDGLTRARALRDRGQDYR